MLRPRLTQTLLLLGAYVLLVIPAGILLWTWAIESLPSDELRILRMVHQQIQDEFVEERDSAELMTEAISGMVESLDPFSRFIAAEDVQAFQETELEGTYQGIGILMASSVAPLTVRTPLEGGPAEAAGLQVGDRILAVDGQDISQHGADEIQEIGANLLRGPAGSPVELSIERGEGEARSVFDVTVARGHVPQPKVRWARLVEPDEGLGYVHLNGFQRDVSVEFDRAIANLRADAQGTEAGDLRGLILDLRGNPGGLLTEAVEMANRFIQSGPLVSLRRRGGEIEAIHEAIPAACSLPALPLVVLVDRSSASASEVLAGALQDLDRAALVGERTYGKGVVQSIYQWDDERFRLKLTTSRYYTPKGRPILPQPRESAPADAPLGGLAPDVPVRVGRDEFIRIRRGLSAYEVPRRYREAAAILEEDLGLQPLRAVSAAEDAPLAAALDTLRERIDGTAGPGDAADTAAGETRDEDGR